MEITCFKAYDVRGRMPDELNPEIALRRANATVEYLGAKKIVVCRDIRLTSQELSDAVCTGILAAGAEAIDIGLGGTEMMYFATSYLGADAGIMVTASHNPADYNGLKIVREEARPISADTGLDVIRRLAESDERQLSERGHRTTADVMSAYIDKIMSFVNPDAFKPLRIVVNPGNGGAGVVLDQLDYRLPFKFINLNYEPDGSFPNGIPNLFDEKGTFIEGYYIVGLLAESILAENPGAKVVHDPRMTWNTLEMVEAAGGEAVQSKSGHSFIKEKMREVDAVYGGEMSAHHYFRDFSYADSGMIPWLLVAELISTSGKSLSQLVEERMAKFPASGEINRKVSDAKATLQALRDRYAPDALSVEDLDGYSFEFSEWRFNIRMSNTEPVVRLNVESRGDAALMLEKTAEVLEILET